MFGLSFSELIVIGVVALVAVGPQKLPGMLRTLGEWVRKLRNLTYEVRAQSGIDDILRAEGLHGGLNELRSLMRGPQAPLYVPPHNAEPAPAPAPAPRIEDPYADFEVDPTREYPPEGPDACGALPDDLVDPGDTAAMLQPQTLAGLAPVPSAEPAPLTAAAELAPHAEPAPPTAAEPGVEPSLARSDEPHVSPPEVAPKAAS